MARSNEQKVHQLVGPGIPVHRLADWFIADILPQSDGEEIYSVWDTRSGEKLTFDDLIDVANSEQVRTYASRNGASRRLRRLISGESTVGGLPGRPKGKKPASRKLTKDDRIKKLLTENARLRKWVNDLQAGMSINCVYCGHCYGPDDEVPATMAEVPATMAEVLKAHIEVCPDHPMSKLKRRYERLKASAAGWCDELGKLQRQLAAALAVGAAREANDV